VRCDYSPAVSRSTWPIKIESGCLHPGHGQRALPRRPPVAPHPRERAATAGTTTRATGRARAEHLWPLGTSRRRCRRVRGGTNRSTPERNKPTRVCTDSAAANVYMRTNAAAAALSDSAAANDADVLHGERRRDACSVCCGCCRAAHRPTTRSIGDHVITGAPQTGAAGVAISPRDRSREHLVVSRRFQGRVHERARSSSSACMRHRSLRSYVSVPSLRRARSPCSRVHTRACARARARTLLCMQPPMRCPDHHEAARQCQSNLVHHNIP